MAQDGEVIESMLLADDTLVVIDPGLWVEAEEFSTAPDGTRELSWGTLGYAAVVRDDAPDVIVDMDDEARYDYADKIREDFDADLGRRSETHNVNDLREHAAAVYVAFLALDVSETVADASACALKPSDIEMPTRGVSEPQGGTSEVTSLWIDDRAQVAIKFDKPITARFRTGQDTNRVTWDALIFGHILSDDAPEFVRSMSAEYRLRFAHALTRHITKEVQGYESDSLIKRLAKFHKAFLAIGILAVAENPEVFVEDPDLSD